MYGKLQHEAKEYIITCFNQLSSKWKFDIDMENQDGPIIVGYGPHDDIIRTPIETFHNHAPKELIEGIMILCDRDDYDIVCGWEFTRYIMKEPLVPPLLMLVDPVEYFRRYSDIIKKYPKLSTRSMINIYGILVEHFQEIDIELTKKYWLLHIMFRELSTDIANVIVYKLVDL